MPFGHSVAGVVRDRDDRHVHRDREARAARLVLRARAGADARALGIDDDPEALREALAALRRRSASIASVPALRSIVIGEASAKPQPKNGIDSSSFLATNASGGKYRLSASVSHVELCLRHHDVRMRARVVRDVLEAVDLPADAADRARAPRGSSGTSCAAIL